MNHLPLNTARVTYAKGSVMLGNSIFRMDGNIKKFLPRWKPEKYS